MDHSLVKMELNLERKCGKKQKKTWEEDTYWKHFNSIHFCVILSTDFHDHLVLPLIFAENMINELPNKVSLIGPSGAVWNVELMKTNNVAFVGYGWKEFVKAFDLEVNSILVFTYKRNFGFEVLILNPWSLCEKETSYFVKKCEQTQTQSNHEGNDKKRSLSDALSTELLGGEDKVDTDSECVVSKRGRKDIEERQRNKPQILRKCLSDGVDQGCSGWDGTTQVVPLKFSTKPMAICGGEKLSGGEAAEEQHVPQNAGSTVETGHSPKSSESTGKKRNGTVTANEQNCVEIGGRTLELAHSQKPSLRRSAPRKSSKTRVLEHGKKPLGNEITEDQNNGVIAGSSIEILQSGKSSKGGIKPKKQVASKSSKKPAERKKQVAPKSSKKPVSENGEKPLENETAKEQNCEIIQSGKFSETRTEAEEHDALIKYSRSGKNPHGIETPEKHDSQEIGGGSLEMVRSKMPRKPRSNKKKLVPKSSKKLISECELLGKKPNGEEAAKERKSPDMGGSTLEIVRSPNSSNIRDTPKKRATPKSSRKVESQSGSAKKTSVIEYVSNRRLVTEQEKEEALKQARQIQTENSFIVIMRPTSVYKRFYLAVPSKWMYKNLRLEAQKVVLRVKDKTWPALFYFYKTNGGGMSGVGWQNFALDNNLEEFDVCCFTLSSRQDDPSLVFDVDIFRVVPEIVPPSLVF